MTDPSTITLLFAAPGPGECSLPPEQRPSTAKADGKAPPPVKWWQMAPAPVDGLDALETVVRRVRDLPCVTVSRHVPAPHVTHQVACRRTGLAQPDAPATLIDAPQQWLPLDIETRTDHERSLWGREISAEDFAADPARYAADVRAALPEWLRPARMFWAVSGSAGRKPGARLHLFAWLDRPITNAEARRLLAPHADAVGVDLTLYDRARHVFTARPADLRVPLELECGRLNGAPFACVPEIPAPTARERDCVASDAEHTREVVRADLEALRVTTADPHDRALIRRVLAGEGPTPGSGDAHQTGARVLGRLRDLFPDATSHSLLELLRPWGNRCGFDPHDASFADIADRVGRIPVDPVADAVSPIDALTRAERKARDKRRKGRADLCELAAVEPTELAVEELQTAAALAIREGAAPEAVGAHLRLDPAALVAALDQADAPRTRKLADWGVLKVIDAGDGAPKVAVTIDQPKLAETFARKHADRCVYAGGVWWDFGGTHWRPRERGLIPAPAFDTYVRGVARGAAKDVPAHPEDVERDVANRAATKSTLDLSASFCVAPEWDTRHEFLNTPDGTYDLRTLERRAHDPRDHLTQCAAVAPDFSDVAQARWREVVGQWAPETDAEGWTRFLQLAVGYSILGPGDAKGSGGHVFLNLGDALRSANGSNGKSTFLGLLQRALGTYAGGLAADAIAVGRQTHSGTIGSLAGKRVGLVDETSDLIIDTDALKKILSVDAQSLQRNLYRPHEDLVIGVAIWVASNRDLVLRSRDAADLRRVRVVPWLRRLTPDPRVAATLRAELLGAALAWAMIGARDYLAAGRLPACASVDKATAAKFSEGDHTSDFVTACVALDPDARATRSELWSAYQRWCAGEGHRPRAAPGFYRELRGLGYAEVKSDGIRGFAGLKVRPANCVPRAFN